VSGNIRYQAANTSYRSDMTNRLRTGKYLQDMKFEVSMTVNIEVVIL
jgi:hypothetical protein